MVASSPIYLQRILQGLDTLPPLLTIPSIALALELLAVYIAYAICRWGFRSSCRAFLLAHVREQKAAVKYFVYIGILRRRRRGLHINSIGSAQVQQLVLSQADI